MNGYPSTILMILSLAVHPLYLASAPENSAAMCVEGEELSTLLILLGVKPTGYMLKTIRDMLSKITWDMFFVKACFSVCDLLPMYVWEAQAHENPTE